jgi:acyl-CoA reductase-like NAD-dependent aldehyde dehydrogenase
MNPFESVFIKQKQFYNTQATKDIAFRKSQLKKLYSLVQSNEIEILQALQKDFSKSYFEGYGTEVGLVLSEIRNQIKNLAKWAAPRKSSGNLLDFYSSAKIYPEPLGQVLIIAPWNYPFLLVFSPLAGAISAGNTIILKPSEITPATSTLIHKLISQNFPEEYICCIEGAKEETENLLKLKFDFIFFTGSETVGKIVLEAAAKNLTRVCLELGGKSPCIIDNTAPVDITCKRIVWGKFVNAGQTCIAPDYLLVHKEAAEAIKEGLKKYILQFYGNEPAKSKDFPRIINLSHFRRIAKLIDPEKVFWGGQNDEKELYISPTILHNISLNDKVMQEEIFGPVLAIIEYSESAEITNIINQGPKPLSFYLFSRDRTFRNKMLREIEAGNGNLNDTVMQFANKNLPFGGKGASGMGSYHGKYSFECFSHLKAINKKSFLFDLPFRYPPYTGWKFGIIKRLLR